MLINDNKKVVGTHGIFEYWWIQGDGQEIDEEDASSLEDNAIDRINELIISGYSSGALISEIYDEESNKETYYHGWWKPKE